MPASFRYPVLLLGLLGPVACQTELPDDSSGDVEADLTGETLFHDGSNAELEVARGLAERRMAPLVERHGLNGLADLVPTRVEVDELGMADVKVQQHFHGVPVFGGEALAVFDATGSLAELSDHLVSDIDVDTTPDLDQMDAEDIAADQAGGWQVLTDDARSDLWVLRLDGQDHLAWRVQLSRMDGTDQTDFPVIFVDAHSGQPIWRLTNMKTATATGTSNYYGTVNLKVYKPSGDTYYYLEHPSLMYSTFSMDGGYSSAYYVAETTTSFTDSTEREAVDAHYAAEGVKNYYMGTHAFNAVDGSGGPGTVTSLKGTYDTLALYVNYGRGYANAYWDGSEMVFGDGDGTWFDPLTTIDITGHEMTHGVTAHFANFTYYGESGALDEGYADIFGSMVERSVLGETSDTWMMGEDCYTPGTSGDALRYMDDPAADGYTVDHYDDLYCDSTDYCGVHANLGIITLAYYLLSEGGNHPEYGGTKMTGIGADEAELIAFRALKKYSTSDTDFADARNSWLDSATDLYTAGSSEYKAVMNAWSLVGVGVSAKTTTCTGYDDAYSGTLSGAGAYKMYVKSTGASYSAGTMKAKLEGPSGTNFNLYLQKKGSDGKWTTVKSSATSGTSSESLTYTAAAGYYRVYIKSTSGSGDFTACFDHP